MSRIYKALEKAEMEKQKREKEPFFGISKENLIISKEPQEEVIESKPLENLNIPQEEVAAPKPLKVKIRAVGPPPFRDLSIAIAPFHSFGAEQFRKLKTFIFRRSPHPPRCLLVTSSAPGEGKTTLAVNLTLSISQEMSKKVILIDGDLRKPNIYCGHYQKGLSDYLREEISMNEIMTNFEADNVMLIPAGSASERAAELIGSKKMKDLITTLKDFGEDTYIIIDSPPVMAASEPLLLSEWVDGVILVVMAGQVRRGNVRKVVDSIGISKIIGVAFNEKDLKPSRDYYYSRYGYGYKREEKG